MRRVPAIFDQLNSPSTPQALSSLRSGYDFTYSAAVRFELTFTQDSTVEKQGYLELGRSCADVCKTLDRGLKRRQSDELSQSVLEATDELTT